MKVRELRQWLKNFDPNAEVVVYEPAHSTCYRSFSLRRLDAEKAPLYIIISNGKEKHETG